MTGTSIRKDALPEELRCAHGHTLHVAQCYKLMIVAQSFENAKAICAQENATLVSIHDHDVCFCISSDTNEFLAKMSTTQQLIGLSYNTFEYVWSDGTKFDYNNWAPSKPLPQQYFGDCVAIGNDGKWINAQCSSVNLPFVCQKPAVHLASTVPTASTTVKTSIVPSSACPDPNKYYFDSGTIISPGYPVYYEGQFNCKYQLIVKNDLDITITFINVNLSLTDSISVYAGFETSNLLAVDNNDNISDDNEGSSDNDGSKDINGSSDNDGSKDINGSNDNDGSEDDDGSNKDNSTTNNGTNDNNKDSNNIGKSNSKNDIDRSNGNNSTNNNSNKGDDNVGNSVPVSQYLSKFRNGVVESLARGLAFSASIAGYLLVIPKTIESKKALSFDSFVLLSHNLYHVIKQIPRYTKLLVEPSESPSSPDQCPKQYYEGGGTIFSPGYSQGYGNNLDCLYFLSVAEGDRIILEFGRIQTQHCCDLIMVFDGPTASGNPSTVYSGDVPSGKNYFFSSTSKLTIRFITSNSHPNGFIGWSANFSRVSVVNAGECFPGWFEGPNTSRRCYRLHQEGLWFEGVRRRCAQEGSRMLSIENVQEDQFVTDLMRKGEDTHRLFWIGLSYLGGQWIWTDGSTLIYERWANNEPNLLHGSCAAIEPWTGQWRAVECDTALWYMCSMDTPNAINMYADGINLP
ncbi:unnamed protein product [Toxocara canis]|uniref:C-type lectin domain-containing protein n=1 Tax=Toxocara canis TaxID=6265 RepID=A0A183UX46_TOXCA|nr:unnamed protein product [Toxocara canis]